VSDNLSQQVSQWDDREPGEFWEGPHGYLKMLEDGTVVPAPERYCTCGERGTATGDLPRYSCDNPECNVVSFA